MALRAVIDHPKFTRLKVLLKLNKSCTLGYLEGIWHFTGRYTPSGHIGKYEEAEIEAWLEWDGEDGALIEAMVKARWLDRDPVHGLIVHDWHKHADDATKLALKRANCSFVVPTESQSCPDTVPTPSRLPEPGAEPVPEKEESAHESKPVDDQVIYPPSMRKPVGFEVCEYMTERGFPNPADNADAFVNFYKSKGWKVGKTPMTDWKAAVHTWETRMKREGQWPKEPPSSASPPIGPVEGVDYRVSSVRGKVDLATGNPFDIEVWKSRNLEATHV